ncbi:hypothetical protein [Polyangium aurulentum]|uniref:HORMA-1 domain-containing protein n=1 Tax=Polyangium aurulentum TaxID=2567896 RepID=UPI0010ADF35D|nr:hypothetical protein [Polyangium aurulentum]UQA57425.1 hypothetical protein E8A73_040090 [Polyangium aurulentum]
MSTTYTASQTSTFSEARARAVMRHVLGDFMNVASAGLIARETLLEWHEEVEYAVLHEALDTFQLQFTKPDGTRAGLSYTVRDDGTILEDSKAGGFDPHSFPPGTKVKICLTYRADAPKLATVREYMRSRGWKTGGSLLAGADRDRAYSKSGFGIARSKVGDWNE